MFILVILLSVLAILVNADNHQIQQHCADFKPQGLVDIDKLMGRWFGVEIILHAKEGDELVKYHDVCPLIYLSDVVSSSTQRSDQINWNMRQDQIEEEQEESVNWDELMEPLVKVWKDMNNAQKKTVKKDGRRTMTPTTDEDLASFKRLTLQKLRLLWNERGTRIEYSLRYNSSKPGYWMSFGGQNGSMLENTGYTQFIGTIQVLKAVRDHVVLTFCHISVRHQFFSVVLAREPDMKQRELLRIHEFLNRRELPVKQIRRMCLHSSASAARSITYVAPILALSLIWHRLTALNS